MQFDCKIALFRPITTDLRGKNGRFDTDSRLTRIGIDLLPVLVEIGAWSLKHRPVDTKKHKHAVDLVRGGDDMLKDVRKELIKDHLKS